MASDSLRTRMHPILRSPVRGVGAARAAPLFGVALGALALAATGLAVTVTPAGADELIVIDHSQSRTIDDPFLPPRAQTDLPTPPRGRLQRGDPARTPLKTDSAAPAARAAGAAPSVRGALRQALLDGRITQEDHDRYRSLYESAREVRKRLPVDRRRELGSVITTLELITERGLLSAERMRPLFLQLQRNTEFWRSRPFPAPGARVSFGDSPLIFQYYAGEGIQIQPLANFGKANQLYNACKGINSRPGTPCRKGALRALLDELVGIAAQREDFTAWEYYFDFGGGSPPWISGLAQGTAIQALAHGSELLGEPSYIEVGRAALAAFERDPPVGIRVPADGGNHYLIYSFNTRLRVLNGFLQSIVGLYDFAQVAADPRAQALFAAGETAARAEVPRYDTGAWSLYSRSVKGAGRESDLGYHRLVRDFLEGLCERSEVDLYCETGERFTRYLLEDPKLNFLGAAGARARRPTRIRFNLSKRSTVFLQVASARSPVYATKSHFGQGVHAFAFTPGRAGRYRVRLEAVDLRNHHKLKRATLTVGR